MPLGSFDFLATDPRRSVDHPQYQPVCDLGSTRVAEGAEQRVAATEEGGVEEPDGAHRRTVELAVTIASLAVQDVSAAPS